MKYRLDKYGNQLSVLGYGCMRFPRKKGRIDRAETERLVRLAVDQGVNYFDTAYIYPGNETAVGEVLQKTGLRDRVYIATKLPHYIIKSKNGLERLFQEQLKRLRTDHVDYYLMHMLNDVDTWQRLKSLGIEEWIAEKQAEGAIRQIGFSYHGSAEIFCKVLDAYDWDFCQVQYNYLDEHSQAGRSGVEYARSKNIPVVIMEPLRGGRLVDLLPEKAKQMFAGYPVRRSPAEWGLRWLWDQEAVTVVLSGMGSEAMLRENLQVADSTDIGALTPEDMELYARVVEEINAGVKVGCTGCGYCQPCPQGVDIPGAFAAYNRSFSEEKWGAFTDYLKCTTLRKNASAVSNCTDCGKCETHCPQNIAIRHELKEVQRTFETPFYRIAAWALRTFAKF